MNFVNTAQAIESQKVKLLASQREVNIASNGIVFNFGIEWLDNYIKDVMSNCDAAYAQVAFASLTLLGFVLAHAGMKNTSLYFLDLSNSGTGKSQNLKLQIESLLAGIIEMQEDLQCNSSNDGFAPRFNNVHTGHITLAAFNQCVRTVPNQLIVMDEIGIQMKKDNPLIDEIIKLYGASTMSLSVVKSEGPFAKNVVPLQLSFIGATTMSYFGGQQMVKNHLGGGFINRPLLAYNTTLKPVDEIELIWRYTIDKKSTNQFIVKLLNFVKTLDVVFDIDQSAQSYLLEFKKEIHAIRTKYNDDGSEAGNLYSRLINNLLIIINILHSLQCFEKGEWESNISIETCKLAVSFAKQVVLKEIDKVIDYLSDNDYLERSEKQLEQIKRFVESYYNKNNQMPKIRDITQHTKINKNDVLNLTKHYLELEPGTSKVKYCGKP